MWYTKGGYEGEWIGDVAKSLANNNDKRFHDWGQSESGMEDLINRCSVVGSVVLDPFCGGGTTGVVAIAMGRKFVGADIDENCIKTSLTRLAEVSNASSF